MDVADAQQIMVGTGYFGHSHLDFPKILNHPKLNNGSIET